MGKQQRTEPEWTTTLGLRRAIVSLTWRTIVAAAVWFGLLWAFYAGLDAIEITRVPMLILVAMGAVGGLAVGFVISRGLDERAGFVSPVLTGVALVAAGIAIIGTEAWFARTVPVASEHLRFIVVTVAMVASGALIVKETLIDS